MFGTTKSWLVVQPVGGRSGRAASGRSLARVGIRGAEAGAILAELTIPMTVAEVGEHAAHHGITLAYWRVPRESILAGGSQVGVAQAPGGDGNQEDLFVNVRTTSRRRAERLHDLSRHSTWGI